MPPLTNCHAAGAMRINVEALQACVSSDNQQALLAGIIRGNSRAARLVNQLLLMMHSETKAWMCGDGASAADAHPERMAVLAPLAAGQY
ncbi:hypothetical protein KIF59_01845 [Enterobacter cloacae subsp. cloacae]|nr:hypothetical protein [Enterobacter cloacae subsp. cloacae]